jgi:hypothetical protein
LECLEDIYSAAKPLEDAMKGKSKTNTLDEAREKLGPDD